MCDDCAYKANLTGEDEEKFERAAEAAEHPRPVFTVGNGIKYVTVGTLTVPYTTAD